MSPRHAWALDEIARGLAVDDPRLARDLARHQTTSRALVEGAARVVLVVGCAAGIAAVGWGLFDAVAWLAVVGAVLCVVLPAGAPLLIRSAAGVGIGRSRS